MYNILVCDDDKEIVEAIDIYLSKEGYNVIKAYDGLAVMGKVAIAFITLIFNYWFKLLIFSFARPNYSLYWVAVLSVYYATSQAY